MCTVTVIPWQNPQAPPIPGRGWVRIACNRDEQHTRPVALPPQVRRFGRRFALLPIDPASEGTWVAVNDAGLAMTLLNVNLGDGDQRAIRSSSRGSIIPALLACKTMTAAVAQASALDPSCYAPFRLVLADGRETAELCCDGSRMGPAQRQPLGAPLLFTSSGLGDRLVEGPRRRLFDEWFNNPDDWPRRQDAFHRHHWPDRPELSVCMRRPDARTVSHTVVTIGPNRVTLAYHPDAPDQPGQVISLSLDRQTGGVP
jgi:hypothetical protein